MVQSLHLLDVSSDAVEQAIGLQRGNLDLTIFAELFTGEQLADVGLGVLQLLPLEMILKLLDGHLFLSEIIQLVAEHFHIDLLDRTPVGLCLPHLKVALLSLA